MTDSVAVLVLAFGNAKGSEAHSHGFLRPFFSFSTRGPDGAPRPQPREARPRPPRLPRRLFSSHPRLRLATGDHDPPNLIFPFSCIDSKSGFLVFFPILFFYFWSREARSRRDIARIMWSSLGFGYSFLLNLPFLYPM